MCMCKEESCPGSVMSMSHPGVLQHEFFKAACLLGRARFQGNWRVI